jgi:hypothetical protein
LAIALCAYKQHNQIAALLTDPYARRWCIAAPNWCIFGRYPQSRLSFGEVAEHLRKFGGYGAVAALLRRTINHPPPGPNGASDSTKMRSVKIADSRSMNSGLTRHAAN